jgi:hypothetical protein
MVPLLMYCSTLSILSFTEVVACSRLLTEPRTLFLAAMSFLKEKIFFHWGHPPIPVIIF